MAGSAFAPSARGRSWSCRRSWRSAIRTDGALLLARGLPVAPCAAGFLRLLVLALPSMMARGIRPYCGASSTAASIDLVGLDGFVRFGALLAFLRAASRRVEGGGIGGAPGKGAPGEVRQLLFGLGDQLLDGGCRARCWASGRSSRCRPSVVIADRGQGPRQIVIGSGGGSRPLPKRACLRSLSSAG